MEPELVVHEDEKEMGIMRVETVELGVEPTMTR